MYLLCTAFLKLPSDELSRLGVDVSREYIAGTEDADILRAAWSRRQAELKELMDKQLKAADYMGELAGHLVNSSVSDEDLLIHLDDLEQLLSDIDNARDFHTIGKWPVLTSLLPGLTQRSKAVQAKAVHCIGTAVKNDYDFQLWVLEAAGGQAEDTESKSVVEILSSAMNEVSQEISTAATLSDEAKVELDELLRRILYAISAAARGNLDVQAALSPPKEADVVSSSYNLPSLVDQLKSCVESPKLSVGVKRKCWHMVADLLDEMVYIRHDVANEYAAMQKAQAAATGDEISEDGLTESIVQILNTLHPIGMNFVTPNYEWLLLAEEVAGQIASTCKLEAEGRQVNAEESCVIRTNSQLRDIFAHVVKVKTVLRNEHGIKLDSAADELDHSNDGNDIDQLTKLRKIAGKHREEVQMFLDHPLMQDQLY
jgi:flagellar hook-basal body complex protein FliE